MDEFTPEQILAQLRELDEQPRIEAKRGGAISDSVMQTLCAFANEPGLGGGYLLLGINEPDEHHSSFYPKNLSNTDKLLNDLQTNCREQFDQPIPVHANAVLLHGMRVIHVFVPELSLAAKPCTFKGKFNSKNKRKTGVWRRGLNGDYECNQRELEPILIAKSGLGFEQVILPSANWNDLDPQAIALYRTLRAKVRPHAEELQVDDNEMLYALNLIKSQNNIWAPNIAGLLLFAKPLALRRLLPAVRVDYVRISGTQWVENPEQRFATTLDLREPLLRLIPKLEANILDDLPKHFHLENGNSQRTDQPLLPQKVIREAVVNAVMHRDYQVHQPILVIRYSNRIEICNAGYSLKPDSMLDEMGSKLRNPILAAVLYDLELAETKGSGIRTMRRLLEQSGLAAPVFLSRVLSNQFQATYLLHQLLGEEQLHWLTQFAHLELNNHETKAIILAKETGAVDNAGLRAVSGLDTLAASQVLSKLHHQYRLLDKSAAGPATYYQLSVSIKIPTFPANCSNTSDLSSNTSDLSSNIDELPPELSQKIKELSPKARKMTLWPIIVWLCALETYKAEQLAKQLNKNLKALKTDHLHTLRVQEKLIDYIYPEIPNHPEQAYKTTNKGYLWLIEQGIKVLKK